MRRALKGSIAKCAFEKIRVSYVDTVRGRLKFERALMCAVSARKGWDKPILHHNLCRREWPVLLLKPRSAFCMFINSVVAESDRDEVPAWRTDCPGSKQTYSHDFGAPDDPVGECGQPQQSENRSYESCCAYSVAGGGDICDLVHDPKLKAGLRTDRECSSRFFVWLPFSLEMQLGAPNRKYA